MTECVLALDLGAGSLRAGVVTPRGRLTLEAAIPTTVTAPRPGWSVADPEAWWRGLVRLVGRILDRLPRSCHVRGLCLSGLTRSQVFLDGAGRPLGPAFAFRDHRAVVEAAELARGWPVVNPADAVTAFHPLARLAWLARHEPRLFARVDAVLEPKDFLNFRLTGVRAADAVTYSRFDAMSPAPASAPDWLGRCLAHLALPRVAPWVALGPVTRREPPFDRLAGLPVFGGAMDTWCAAVGAGATEPGQGYDVAGTSEAVGLITRGRAAVAGLVSLLWGERVHQLGGPTQAGADCARWGHRLLRLRGGLAAAVERAGALAVADDGPLFLPYLAGERAPLWRADVRGTLDGLALGHDADALFWAILEGVAQAGRDILTTAVGGAGVPLSEVRLAGGGARSEAWCQLKADVMGVPTLRPSHRETGLVGAAIAAAVGLGWHPSLTAAARAMCAIERVFEPRAAAVAVHAGRAVRYRRRQQELIARADVTGSPASLMPPSLGPPGRAPGARRARA